MVYSVFGSSVEENGIIGIPCFVQGHVNCRDKLMSPAQVHVFPGRGTVSDVSASAVTFTGDFFLLLPATL